MYDRTEEESREEQGGDRENTRHLSLITDGENDDGIYIKLTKTLFSLSVSSLSLCLFSSPQHAFSSC